MISKGTILDGTYEVISEIGAGGGGIVYKARHLRLQTDVVIKKIKDSIDRYIYCFGLYGTTSELIKKA